MNTVRKGNRFERQALLILKNAIENGLLGLPDCIKIYFKKGYYSEKRKKEIIFDMSIEVWPPNAKRYSLLYIIECKNYKLPIPVNDIEEFHSKILQLEGINVKGVFITNNGFQESAFNLADSLRMMLIRGESTSNYEIILHKSNHTCGLIPFLKGVETCILDIGVQLIEKEMDKIIGTAFQNTEHNKPLISDFNIATLSKEDIEMLAETELNKIDPLILSKAFTLSNNKLDRYIIDELGFKIEKLSSGSSLWGAIEINNKKIYIHPSLFGTHRYPFVLAHEFGHLKIHSNLKMDQGTYNSFSDPEYNFQKDKFVLKNPKDWIEWQANYYGSSIILPRRSLLARLSMYQEKYHIRQGKIFLDDQYSNVKTYREIITHLAYIFSVSKTSVIFRLNDLQMVNNKMRLKTVGQIIDENFEFSICEQLNVALEV